MKAKTWTTAELAKSSGLDRNKIHHLVICGVITPTVDDGKGTGHKRVFSRNDLARFGDIVELRKCGMTCEGIKRFFARGNEVKIDLTAWIERQQEGR